MNTNTIMTTDENAQLLSGFLTILFGKDTVVHIYPCLSKKGLQDVLAGNSIPATLHGRDLVYFPLLQKNNHSSDPMNEQWDDEILSRFSSAAIPRRVLDPFSRRAGCTHPKLISRLNDFVALGYDIYFCPNPLTYSKRCQWAVSRACHLVLECDDPSTPVETQKAILNTFKDAISAMVFTGNRSVHAYVRLDPPIWNGDPITWKTRNSHRSKECPYWDSYKMIAAHWIKKCAEQGLKIDSSVATDCCHLTRLPGFAHSNTGKVSEILFLNPDASFDWYWETQMACSFSDNETGSGNGNENVNENRKLPENAETPETLETPDDWTPDIPVCVSHLEDCLVPYSIASIPSVNPVDPVDPVNPDNPSISVNHITNNTQKPVSVVLSGIGIIGNSGIQEQKVREKREPVETNVIHYGRFLDELKRYDSLQQKGIPSRHTRRTLHRIMFTAARILGMSETQMADEWKRIVGLRPENIDCSAEYAVTELLNAYRAVGDFTFYIPNTSRLPDLDDQRITHLKKWLVAKKCTRAADVLKIIRYILWDCVRILPVQCQEGKIGLRSVVLQRTCRGNGRYKAALAWMEEENIVRMTDDDYEPRRKPRLFFINIPLLLYIAGFKAADLDWSPLPRQKRGDDRQDGLLSNLNNGSNELYKMKKQEKEVKYGYT